MIYENLCSSFGSALINCVTSTESQDNICAFSLFAKHNFLTQSITVSKKKSYKINVENIRKQKVFSNQTR